MYRRPRGRSLVDMQQRLLFAGLVLGVVMLALGGWTVQGVRRFGAALALRPVLGS